jgi:molybdopterin synthase catalytic subunit/molybdopterin converting factor small subunit
MDITILLFSSLRDLVGGQNRLTLHIPQNDITLADVRQKMIEKYPQLEANLAICLASVNREYAFNEDPVADGDEVAFFPPVSGGSGDDTSWPELFQLPDQPIDHDQIIAAITTPATGAVALFSGIVRGKTDKDGHLPQTEQLEYEAYAPMALEKMRQVAAEIRRQWPLVQGIAIVQRVGRLNVGENTVLIACSAAHRDQGCFEGARYGIDRLKEIVPVWKKEISPDGAEWIEGDYRPTAADRADGL